MCCNIHKQYLSWFIELPCGGSFYISGIAVLGGQIKFTILTILHTIFARIIWIFAPLSLKYLHLLSPWFLTIVANLLSTLNLLLLASSNSCVSFLFRSLKTASYLNGTSNRLPLCKSFPFLDLYRHWSFSGHFEHSALSNLNTLNSLLFVLLLVITYSIVVIPLGQVTELRSPDILKSFNP